MPPALLKRASAKAAAISAAVSPDGGDKLTRAEKRKQNREKAAAVQAAVLTAERLRAGLPPDVETLARADEGVLVQEIARPTATPVEPASDSAVTVKGEGSRGGQIGRPSEYTQEEADRICEWIQSGKSLNQYCRVTGRTPATVYGWMRADGAFLAAYARAHEDRADTLVDEMLDIADDSAGCGDISEVQAAKLRIETRKWIAQKMRPGRYGDQVLPAKTGNVQINIGIPRRLTDSPPVQVVASD
jgi:hypothetical protein